ncbi:MAG: hypothetical protein KDI46_07265 [Alphaproteobacteria bacterium]|nr:hypothetical protein [Alphaproteobacteria bacterium]
MPVVDFPKGKKGSSAVEDRLADHLDRIIEQMALEHFQTVENAQIDLIWGRVAARDKERGGPGF